MRPSAERLWELRTGLFDASERLRKVAGSYANDLAAVGHPESAASAISEAEAVMLRHNDRMTAINTAVAQADQDPDEAAAAIEAIEQGLFDVGSDLRILDTLAPVIEAAVATARPTRTIN